MTTKTKKTKVWRLSERPTIDGLLKLVKGEIINGEQANEILFREEEINSASQSEIKDIKQELKLLRTLVLELSTKQPQITAPIIIKEIERVKEWPNRPDWYWSYYNCSNTMDKMFDHSTGTYSITN